MFVLLERKTGFVFVGVEEGGVLLSIPCPATHYITVTHPGLGSKPKCIEFWCPT